jgi:hypothetical protein
MASVSRTPTLKAAGSVSRMFNVTDSLQREKDFVTLTDIVEMQRRDLFAILEHEDETCNYFIMKCNEYGKEMVINARDKRKDSEGRSLLHACCSKGLIIGVAFLMELGHSIDCIDSSTTKITPLFEAIRNNNLDIASILIKSGANINYQDRNLENCLHFAARVGSARMVEVLIKMSDLSPSEVQQLASVPNIKLKFPEDLTTNSLVREVLVNYRSKGFHLSVAMVKAQARENKRQAEIARLEALKNK